MSETSKKSIFTDLWERRVPQFVATYVGICWGILQFLIFATNRYGLANHFIDRFLIFALILLPAVGIFIYNHGSPGKDKWKRYEKILIPINFVVALLFAGLFGSGNEVQAATQEVKVTTEQGDTITRMIPAIEQTKSFAMFPFMNKSDRTDDNWIKFAIPHLLKTDMEQDMRFFCLSPFSFEYNIESNNHSIDDNNISFATFSKIAKDKIVNFFVTGEYSFEGENLVCDIKIYETKTGEIFWERKFSGESIYSIVDVISHELSDNLYLEKNQNTIAHTDLPASNLITGNIEALKLFFNNKRMRLEANQPTLVSNITKANALDPQSAALKHELAISYAIQNKIDSSRIIIGQALDYSETLPERQKFRIKQDYYQINDQRDKYLPLLESWKKLYPSDFYPYNALLDFYRTVRNTKKAKAVGLDALNNGHGARILKRLAGICIERKEFIEAEKYIDEYYALFPEKRREEDIQLADIYLKKGEFEKAKKWYESISLLNPNDYEIAIKLSNVYNYTGQFDKSDQSLDLALRQCKLAKDSLNVYIQKIYLYSKTGQVSKFDDAIDQHFNLISPGPNKTQAIFAHLQLASVYAYMGQEDKFYANAEYIKQNAPQFLEIFICVTDFLTSMVTNDPEKLANGTTPKCTAMLTQSTPSMTYLVQGIISKSKNDHADAIRFFETYIDSTETDSDNFGGWIAEQYRLSNNYDKAIEYCLESLKLNPNEGTFLLELSKSYLAKGNKAKAKEAYLKLKNKVWHKAEPGYFYYQELIDLGESLKE